jgi:hypothetical protein
VKWARRLAMARMLARVVSTLPATPSSLQWMCAACGSPSVLPASTSVSMMARGVTRDEPIGVSSVVRSRAPRFHSSTPPGLTIFRA